MIVFIILRLLCTTPQFSNPLPTEHTIHVTWTKSRLLMETKHLDSLWNEIKIKWNKSMYFVDSSVAARHGRSMFIASTTDFCYFPVSEPLVNIYKRTFKYRSLWDVIEFRRVSSVTRPEQAIDRCPTLLTRFLQICFVISPNRSNPSLVTRLWTFPLQKMTITKL